MRQGGFYFALLWLKRFSLVFPEGRDFHGGWSILAENLRYLSVAPSTKARRVSPPAKARSTYREETTCESFYDIVRKPCGVAGEAVWVQIGESEAQGREEFL